jgi:endonuclease/exonuclease/phosphatase family metal-dependent hydrolase
MKLVLASYNIHRCHGRDGTHDPARTREVLRRLDADVLALQEVESLRNEPGLLEYFCEGTPWTAIHGPTLERDSGEYGNAVLTSLPVRSMRQIDISQSRHEPRGALHVVLDHRGVSFQLLATHLGLWPAERRAQIKQLLALLRNEFTDAGKPSFTVLMGDLNEWFLWGRPLRMLKRHFRPTPAPATWPARHPLFALDRVWVQPRHRLLRVKAINTPLARAASDHLPLVAELASGRLEHPAQQKSDNHDNAGHENQRADGHQ